MGYREREIQPRPGKEIDAKGRETHLVERGIGIAVALDTAHFPERLFEGRAEGDGAVL